MLSLILAIEALKQNLFDMRITYHLVQLQLTCFNAHIWVNIRPHIYIDSKHGLEDNDNLFDSQTQHRQEI